MHVCWYRNTSVSRADHSAAVEVRPHEHHLSAIWNVASCLCTWLLRRGPQEGTSRQAWPQRTASYSPLGRSWYGKGPSSSQTLFEKGVSGLVSDEVQQAGRVLRAWSWCVVELRKALPDTSPAAPPSQRLQNPSPRAWSSRLCPGTLP